MVSGPGLAASGARRDHVTRATGTQLGRAAAGSSDRDGALRWPGIGPIPGAESGRLSCFIRLGLMAYAPGLYSTAHWHSFKLVRPGRPRPSRGTEATDSMPGATHWQRDFIFFNLNIM